LSIWDVASGRRRLNVRPDTGIRALAWGPDGRYLALGCQDGVIRLWDASTERALPPMGTGNAAIVSLAFAPDGGALASVDQAGDVVLWEVGSVQRPRRWSMPGRATRVAYAPDGRHLVVAQVNGMVSILRLAPDTKR
jgi:WD40 repeat protein